jgi:murein DD-endopeptidase MepM/ murein hydrolase activator NlpD
VGADSEPPGQQAGLVLPALPAAALVLALAAPPTAAPEPGSGWDWPLEPVPRVVSGFDPPASPWGPGHRGVDLASAVGAPVRSVGAGRVGYAGQVAGRGVVSVEHPGGLRTTYEPVTPAVSVGDEVARGDLLGTVSAAPGHCLPATCLHWGVLRGETYLDPLALVGVVPVRLLPLRGNAGRG